MAKGITPREKDYAQWYIDVVLRSEMAELLEERKRNPVREPDLITVLTEASRSRVVRRDRPGGPLGDRDRPRDGHLRGVVHRAVHGLWVRAVERSVERAEAGPPGDLPPAVETALKVRPHVHRVTHTRVRTGVRNGLAGRSSPSTTLLTPV